MPSSFFTKFLISFISIFCVKMLSAQDRIPVTMGGDSTQTNALFVRAFNEKVKIIPRGVKLANRKASFKAATASNIPRRLRTPSFWERLNHLGLSISEVAFVNWNAGGNNSISAIANGRFERNYKFRYIQWNNKLSVRYGINVQEGEETQKTDDALRFSSAFSYRRDTISNWYYSARANFNTQFYEGYKYPDRETPISGFMAPGYLFFGAGTSYIEQGKKFNLYISPMTLKSTFVLDQNLANKGAFGVQGAILDADGNIIKEGERRFIEFGFLINHNWEASIAKNVGMRHNLSLYTDYLSSFGNIDIDWELNFDLTVNKYINASIGTHIIYDDDVLFDTVKDPNGIVVDEGVQRIQFKQLLGVGLTYDF